MRFGGFPEPLIKGTDSARKRWQNQYFTDLVREDVIEFSRIHEIRSMALLLEMLRTRTGSPLSFDALGREIDFVIADEHGNVERFIEAKVGNTKPSTFLVNMAAQHPHASATQLVVRAPHAFDANGVCIRPAAQWLSELAA